MRGRASSVVVRHALPAHPPLSSLRGNRSNLAGRGEFLPSTHTADPLRHALPPPSFPPPVRRSRGGGNPGAGRHARAAVPSFPWRRPSSSDALRHARGACPRPRSGNGHPGAAGLWAPVCTGATLARHDRPKLTKSPRTSPTTKDSLPQSTSPSTPGSTSSAPSLY